MSKLCFIFMTTLAFIVMSLKGYQNNGLLNLFRFILLFSSIIPISLRVNLDFAKMVFAYKIGNDPNIEGTVVRNGQIPEELGRIQFVLSDKTGTLTQNDMIFKKISLESLEFNSSNLPLLQKILKRQCEKHDGPLSDVKQRLTDEYNSAGHAEPFGQQRKRKNIRRDRDYIVRDLITALVLCHNVTPVLENGEKVYQASSPDEIALVKIAEQMNVQLVSRTQNLIEIKNAAGKMEKYDVLANFPFTSDSKRMGIILRHQASGSIVFYLKGADSVMKNKVPEVQRGFLLDETENLAREGLRTLVITQKFVTQQQYESWNTLFKEANNMLTNRELHVRKVIDLLEQDMEFLGIT